jgi:DNA replication and repair protein RecF
VRLRHLVVRGFRNLVDLEHEPSARGAAVLGANAQGKTSLLEAIYYPVLFRSFRGASDLDVARFDGPGFHVEVGAGDTRGGDTKQPVAEQPVAVTYHLPGRRKRITAAGDEVTRIADAVGLWLAVAFLPADVALASGPAAGRRQYLDRLLSLADRMYLRTLLRYRAALAQRNSALRQGRVDVARAFNGVLAGAGAEIVRARRMWVTEAAKRFSQELECLGEPAAGRLSYDGRPELADAAAWAAALDERLPRDRARGLTTLGPHRDDLVLEIGGRSLREYGSTGQVRTAAVALKLLEIATLRDACRTEPALLLDDVFAELDRDRQERLARRLLDEPERQLFVTAPRRDELPAGLDLPIWYIKAGHVEESA